MNSLIDRYLDGDLSEREAEELLEAIAADPEQEAELRDYERMLAAGGSVHPGGPSAGFTDRVMRRVHGSDAREMRRPRFPGLTGWQRGLAWAAAALIVFSVGRFSAGSRPSSGTEPGPAPSVTASTVDASPRLRMVRLVYAPSNPEVAGVAVAGTFNGWNPDRTLMQREGNLWTTQLVLPRDVYEYVFVIDGEEWVTDPLALETRDDGFGRENAVLDLTM